MFNFSHGGWLVVMIISVLGALFVGLPTVIGGNIDRGRARDCANLFTVC